jgi:ASC-1-like (ASCH) protein
MGSTGEKADMMFFNNLAKINNGRIIGQMVRSEQSREIQIGDIIAFTDELYALTAVSVYGNGCSAGVTLKKLR